MIRLSTLAADIAPMLGAPWSGGSEVVFSGCIRIARVDSADFGAKMAVHPISPQSKLRPV